MRWEYINQDQEFARLVVGGDSLSPITRNTSKVFTAEPAEEIVVYARTGLRAPERMVAAGTVEELAYPAETLR